MSVSNQATDEIDQEVVATAMTGMGNLRDVLQLVINCFNDGPLA